MSVGACDICPPQVIHTCGTCQGISAVVAGPLMLAAVLLLAQQQHCCPPPPHEQPCVQG